MKRKFLIGLCQLDSGEDVAQNLEKIGRMISEAVTRGAQVISLPENANYVGLDGASVAEEVPGGKTFAFLSEQAKKHGIWIHGGSIYETSSDKRPHNSTMVIDPQGNLVTTYHKIHPFDVVITDGPSVKESDRIFPGNRIVTVDTGEYGKWGLSICYDMRFPELYRIMALEGVQIFFCPSDFTLNTGRDHWLELLRARAIENNCYMVAAGQIGKKPRFQAFGRSVVIDPWGTVIAQAPDTESVIIGEIDLDRVDAVRNQLYSLANRRDDIYRLERK